MLSANCKGIQAEARKGGREGGQKNEGTLYPTVAPEKQPINPTPITQPWESCGGTSFGTSP